MAHTTVNILLSAKEEGVAFMLTLFIGVGINQRLVRIHLSGLFVSRRG